MPWRSGCCQVRRSIREKHPELCLRPPSTSCWRFPLAELNQKEEGGGVHAGFLGCSGERSAEKARDEEMVRLQALQTGQDMLDRKERSPSSSDPFRP